MFLVRCKYPLLNAAAEGGGAGGASQAANTAAAIPVDVAAIEQAAVAKAQAGFAAQLKEHTGFESLEALKADKLKADGKLQELLDATTAKAGTWHSKFQQSAIAAALVSASVEAVDPAVISALLAGCCVCDDDGKVTIDGKPVAEAVKALLAEKPFLAKATSGTGSGASAQSAGAAKTITRAQLDALSPADRMKHFNDGGTVTD